MMKHPVIAFIGPGNMARSLIGGLIADHYPAESILASGPHVEHLESLNRQFSINTMTDNKEAVKQADIVVLAVKPQMLKQVALEIAPVISQQKPLVISVVTGVRSSVIQSWFGEKIAIVRCMPNTPALVNCGATALFANAFVSDAEKEQAESIMRAVGLVLWLDDENKLDVVTGLSGSGPAYFFLVIEILQAAGVALGLTEQESKLLTLQTALGAARMALESDQDASVLRKAVTSPGGTTERAIQILESAHLSEILSSAVQGAVSRAKELSDSYS
jgi:pyrroline-5-carboxylate reductase